MRPPKKTAKTSPSAEDEVTDEEQSKDNDDGSDIRRLIYSLLIHFILYECRVPDILGNRLGSKGLVVK